MLSVCYIAALHVLHEGDTTMPCARWLLVLSLAARSPHAHIYRRQQETHLTSCPAAQVGNQADIDGRRSEISNIVGSTSNVPTGEAGNALREELTGNYDRQVLCRLASHSCAQQYSLLPGTTAAPCMYDYAALVASTAQAPCAVSQHSPAMSCLCPSQASMQGPL